MAAAGGTLTGGIARFAARYVPYDAPMDSAWRVAARLVSTVGLALGLLTLAQTAAAAPVDRVIDLSGGTGGRCEVRASGIVLCTGADELRATGIAYNSSNFGPYPPVGLTQVTGIADARRVEVGPGGACAIRAQGRVSCWGHGLLALSGSAASTHVARAIPGLMGVTDLAVAEGRACAVDDAGTVRCWGDDREGGAGQGSTEPVVTSPTAVPGLPLSTAVASTASTTCARTRAGTVYCWGGADGGSLARPDGEFPLHNTGFDRWEPWSPAPVRIGTFDDATDLSGSVRRFCVTRDAFGVQCWGAGSFDGPAGSSDHQITTVPNTDGATQVVVGYDGGCALVADGRVHCFGGGEAGELGSLIARSEAGVEVRGLRGARMIASGFRSRCAVTETERVTCWGAEAAKLAEAPLDRISSDVALTVPGLTGVTTYAALAGGRWCATTVDGQLWCTGFKVNAGPRPGEDPLGASPTPVDTFTDASEVVAGRGFWCVRRTTGRVHCSGRYRASFLYEPVADLAEPIRPNRELSAIAFSQVVAGDDHACGLQSDGRVSCWGNSDEGQGGGHPDANTSTIYAREAPSISDAVQVAADRDTSCARRANGTVWCWGAGAGVDDAGRPTPTVVPRQVPLAGLAAGLRSSPTGFCAELATGAQQCFFEHASSESERATTCQIVAAKLQCRGDGANGGLGQGSEAYTWNRTIATLQSSTFVVVPPPTTQSSTQTPTPTAAPTPPPAPTPTPTPAPRAPSPTPRAEPPVVRSGVVRRSRTGLSVRVAIAPGSGPCPAATVQVVRARRTVVTVRAQSRAEGERCVLVRAIRVNAAVRRSATTRVVVVLGSSRRTFVPRSSTA